MNRDRMRLLLTFPRNGRSMPLNPRSAKQHLRFINKEVYDVHTCILRVQQGQGNLAVHAPVFI
jgi:hypothetical protein